jgi:hypothetical protein
MRLALLLLLAVAAVAVRGVELSLDPSDSDQLRAQWNIGGDAAVTAGVVRLTAVRDVAGC